MGDLNCPKCIGKLSKVEVAFYEVYEKNKKAEKEKITLEVDQCFFCNGIWFDAGELEKYIEKKMTRLDSPFVGAELYKKMDNKIAKCPRCNLDMVKKHAPKDRSIIIDYCEKCSGVWLDGPEIDKIEAKNVALNEKIGLAIRKLFKRKDSGE